MTIDCVICKNGKTTKGLVNVPIVREDKIIFIKNTPAEICNNCGEYYIDTDVAKELYHKANERMDQGVEMEVTQYSPLV
ncbi:MAG: type II toxin-antitoxin system MqsA family antitoxin [Bacteroidota bacterium]|nr:type II toxin-antitoxin system MqsA family antitoxin [Bacteroidota bacterium]